MLDTEILTEEEKNRLFAKEPLPKKRYEKTCTICDLPFETTTKSKNICSWECKKEHNRRHARFYARTHRNYGKVYLPCVICGFSQTTDQHSEGGKKYTLCPNHHALITRNLKTLQQLFMDSSDKLKVNAFSQI